MKVVIKATLFSLFLCTMFLLSGCSSLSPQQEKEPPKQVSQLTVGNSLEVENIDSRLLLVDDNSTLAADGLYYASWGMGDTEPYTNSDGDVIDLYDASLYLLLGESKDSSAAEKNRDVWLEAARTNYDILEEKEQVYNGCTYTVLTYNCASEDNPYARGISAFGAFGDNAVCLELACREHFEEDLASILTTFLDNCSYITE